MVVKSKSSMKINEGLSFDDVLLVPRYTAITPAQTELTTPLTRNLRLNIPLISAAMDTVTAADTAIVMAQHGGLGVVHKNFSVTAQAQEVSKVKRSSAGLVGAAVSPAPDCGERVAALLAACCDVLVLDTAHGHSQGVIEAVKMIKRTFSAHDYELIAGNIATADAVRALIDAGADAVKVGVGPGSICTTRIVAGVGVPQLTAIMNCAQVAAEHGVPVIADGGVRFAGDILKACAAGASTVMIGGLLAGTDEAPGETILHAGKKYKSYRGMGSMAAMQAGSKDRYQQTAAGKLVPEGVEGLVPYTGALSDRLQQLVGGLRAGLGYIGARSMADIPAAAEFIKLSPAGLKESHVHDVVMQAYGK